MVVGGNLCLTYLAMPALLLGGINKYSVVLPGQTLHTEFFGNPYIYAPP